MGQMEQNCIPIWKYWSRQGMSYPNMTIMEKGISLKKNSLIKRRSFCYAMPSMPLTLSPEIRAIS